MPRRKKRGNLNFIIIALAIVIGGWIAVDFYLNVYRQPQKNGAVGTDAAETGAKNKNSTVGKSETTVPVSENGFKMTSYADDRYGIEFQYPVFAGDDPKCPKLEKDQDGLFIGGFSFLAGEKTGTFEDFLAAQLQEMEVEKREDVSLAGKAAVKVDYQTKGMGWYGSSVFVEGLKNFFEFGLLANEAAEKCGGINDYEDRVYQSVISTLKFSD